MSITQDRLRELLDYNPQTGEFTRRAAACNRVKVGDAAGSREPDGYLLISVDGCRYRAHRLAWLYMHGEFPDGHLDHINGVRHDNRVSNLRVATHAENMQNQRRAQRSNSVGVLGVSRKGRRFSANISANGAHTYLGSFDTPEAASAAYQAAKAQLHIGSQS